MLRRVLTSVLCAALLSGCSGDDGGLAPEVPSSVPTTDTDGSTLPGTSLALGESAVVRFKAGRQRTSLIELTVTSVKPGSRRQLVQFELPAAARHSDVFYVRVTVVNTDRSDLAGEVVTLYGMVSDSRVVPPVTFGSPFDRCEHRALPRNFTKDARTQLCMVMLAPKHGRISAIQWRGNGHVEPILWAVR